MNIAWINHMIYSKPGVAGHQKPETNLAQMMATGLNFYPDKPNLMAYDWP